MNKKYLLFVMIFILSAVVLAATPALAAGPETECQPGANNHVIGEWQELTVEEFAAALIETFGSEPYPGAALDRAQAIYDFCDHNGDGKACVMLQTFPVTVFTIVDNHPYGGK